MISIIVPVYNVEKYLDDCLLSISQQSYKDWECVLVDDGSQDASGHICDSWSNKDSRFRVLHQPNGGVSKARNAGIDVAKGDCVTFVDSDDWIDEEYLYELGLYSESDIVVTGVINEYPEGTYIQKKPSDSSEFRLNECGLDSFVNLNRQFLLYAPYSKLYKRSILVKHDIRFPEYCSFGEDLQFNYHYLDYVKTIYQVDAAHYHYRIIGSGTLSSRKRTDQFQQDYEQWILLKYFYMRHGLWLKPSKELLYERLWGIVYDGLFGTCTSPDIILSIPEIKELKEYQHVFTCSKWIKWCILHKMSIIFKIKR